MSALGLFDHLISLRNQSWQIVRPSALAVLRLITNPNLIGRSIGKSAGLALLKTLSMKSALRRYRSELHSFGVPSGIPDPSVRTFLSEPFGAACIPGGVSPCGLEAGAPPVDLVSIGPVLSCGCVTLPLGLPVVDWSIEFGWENAVVEADNIISTVRTIILPGMVHLQRTYSKSRRVIEFHRPDRLSLLKAPWAIISSHRRLIRSLRLRDRAGRSAANR